MEYRRIESTVQDINGKNKRQGESVLASLYMAVFCTLRPLCGENFARVCIGKKGKAIARAVYKPYIIIAVFALQHQAHINFAVEVIARKIGQRLFLAALYGV